AIVYAALSSGKMSSGDIEGAKKMAANARMWCLIGLGAGLLMMVLQAVYFAVVLMAQN
ncbi:CD225/dispanin family protein, partial [bacterium]|nr:CD225/dispanin family protein [bacterium]